MQEKEKKKRKIRLNRKFDSENSMSSRDEMKFAKKLHARFPKAKGQLYLIEFRCQSIYCQSTFILSRFAISSFTIFPTKAQDKIPLL